MIRPTIYSSTASNLLPFSVPSTTLAPTAKLAHANSLGDGHQPDGLMDWFKGKSRGNPDFACKKYQKISKNSPIKGFSCRCSLPILTHRLFLQRF